MEQSVKLVSYTQPAPGMAALSASQLLSYIARVSNPSNQENFDTAEKLWGYCLRKSHWSPFEMVDVTVEINTTRDIGRQILRHRSFSFQEFSQRYAEVPTDDEDFYFREARLQDKKNRQSSIEVEDPHLQSSWNEYQRFVKDAAVRAYRWAIARGIAKEQARAVLPEGMTPSVMYMKGSLRSWIHYCALRRGNGTQKEHRQIADMCWSILTEMFPPLRNFNFWMDESGDVPVLRVDRIQSPEPEKPPQEEPQVSFAQKSSDDVMEKILESYLKNSASGLPYG